MKNIHNAISDTIEKIDDQLQIQLQYVPMNMNGEWKRFMFVRQNKPKSYLEIEICIDEKEESIVATVLHRVDFTRSELFNIMNTFTHMFD